ncbi:hypothetical protein C5167_050230 [Papaver somniferum]|uniref:Rhodanese domain-containing protein n=1 Tax=Papaver somniferum TaxID=3469 RepID=A0A4Y7KQY3_PAPSO|nr:calcium sensing receptor, chloroplastic-like [Papaver somniferum]RZC74750.1 hypothetical protein C5167_050230 [Papaver somniferum]
MVAMEMAFRAAATAKPPPCPSSNLQRTPPLLKRTTNGTPHHHHSRNHIKPISLSIPTTSTAVSLFTLFTSNDANAFSFSKDQIMNSLTQVEGTIDQAEEVGSGVFDFTGRVIRVVIDGLKPTVDIALPILKSAGDQALKIASPVFSEASKKAQETFQSSGFDTEPVVSAAKTVAGAAQQTGKVIQEVKPIASSTVETLSSTDPVVILGTAGALFVTYLLLPPIWSGISYSLRGYKGKLTPAQTLDLISTKNYLMVDVRSEKDKNKSGTPRLPSSAKNKMITVPLEELPSKIKGIVRNSKKVEAEIAALKISYLKRLNKGSNIVIMDSYSDTAKIVAKSLTSLGFKNCYIMADGFSGSKGWAQSRLGTDSPNLSFAEVISPSRVIPAVSRFGTTGSRSNQKFLSGSTE